MITMFSAYKKEGYIEAIDLLKLFALLLVIFGHSIIKCVADLSSGPIYNFVYLVKGANNYSFLKLLSLMKKVR